MSSNELNGPALPPMFTGTSEEDSDQDEGCKCQSDLSAVIQIYNKTQVI